VRARDVMRPAVATIGPDDSLADLDALLLAEHVGGVPVVDRDALVGVVSRSDVLRLLGTEQAIADSQSDFYRQFSDDEPGAPGIAASVEAAAEQVAHRLARLRVRDAMATDVVAVDGDAPLRDVAQQLVARGIHRVVVTERGRLAGIVTAFDVVRLVAEGRLR
jgi:CBS domain-containing protein